MLATVRALMSKVGQPVSRVSLVAFIPTPPRSLPQHQTTRHHPLNKITQEGLREVASGWQALAWGVLPSLAALLAARAAIDLCVGEGPRCVPCLALH